MKITIDNLTVEVSPGTTVMEAASQLGITIPSMCWQNGRAGHPSCMVCMVQDLSTGRMIPSCSMPVADGMKILTHSPGIREIRRQALELLLGDHVGDCEAPCRLSCPAFMNIPLMNRLIVGGHPAEALRIVREEIALPLVLGFICPAPCEKACHRGSVDEPVSICMLKRFTASSASGGARELPWMAPANGRKVAVIGSGPAGLSAAFYLRRMGYGCTVFERSPEAGGALRYEIPADRLPAEALEEEISILRQMGAEILTGCEIGREQFEAEILPGFDAVILATGPSSQHPLEPFSLQPDEHGNLINRKTGATSRPGVFGCGSASREQRMAVRSAAQGKLAAMEADLYLTTGQPVRMKFSFHSAISRLEPEEFSEYLQEADPVSRISPSSGWLQGFSEEEARTEAARCMHCDCRKPVTCKLRILSDEYQANRKRFAGPGRKRLTRLVRHDLLVYEPEKCIRCGHCVEIAAQHGEAYGFTFIGRGFDVRIGVPAGKSLEEGITRSAWFCAEGCPTGALSFRDQEEGVEYGKRCRMTGKGWENIGPGKL